MLLVTSSLPGRLPGRDPVTIIMNPAGRCREYQGITTPDCSEIASPSFYSTV
jgi:hypothetical protein